jgi:type VI secretion system VasD/TssJ family lipoprotein
MKAGMILPLLVLALLTSSCSMFSSQASREAYKKEDISIIIKADPQLNKYKNSAHALYLCIYQLKDPNGFNQLTEDKDGIGKLMECNRFDPTVGNAKRLVIQPGQEMKDIRDRAEGTRYIGIVTGYYGTGREKLTHILPHKPASSIEINLGPNEISSVTVK